MQHEKPVVPFRLFVYGTLKRLHPLHRMLAGQKYLGEVVTVPAYRLFDIGPYPGLRPCDGEGDRIQGELYLVAPELIPTLDRYESAPSLFSLAPIDLGDGTAAFAYFFADPRRLEGHPAPPPGNDGIVCWNGPQRPDR